MGTWVTDPITGIQKWQGSQYLPSGGPVYAWGDWIDPNNPDAGRYAMDIAPIAIQSGLPSYNSINVGADNYFLGNVGYYYKLIPGEGEQGARHDFNTRYTKDYLMGQTSGGWGAIPMTINPEYNVDDGTMTGLLGAGLLFGGLGALGGLGGLFGGADSGLYGLELGGEGVGAALGGTPSVGGLYGLELGGEGVGAALGGSPTNLAEYINTLGEWPTGGVSNATGGMIPSGTYNPGSVMDEAAKNALTSTVKSMIPGISDDTLLKLGTGGLQALGGWLSGRAGQEAAQTNADAQIEAARIAAEAAKFKPVGVKTRFGESQFIKDAQGNVIGAGYGLTPDIKAQQDALIGTSGQMLPQFQNSMTATAPMGTAAQRAMTLGQGYLNTDPLAQAQKYYQDQQAVMATQRERDLMNLENRLMAQGRLGLATGGTSTGMMPSQPEMEALRNAQKQQDLQLAAAATQGGMDYAKFGAGMVGTGGDLLKSMYGTQVASLDPWKTAMGGAQYLEGLGQNAMDLGINIGKVASPAQSGQLLAQGMMNAANIRQGASYSPWGTALMGAGNALQNFQTQNQQQAQQNQLNQMFASALSGNQAQPLSASWNWGGTWV